MIKNYLAYPLLSLSWVLFSPFSSFTIYNLLSSQAEADLYPSRY